MNSFAGWNLSGWVIDGGEATSPGDASALWRELEIPTVNGATYTAALAVTINPEGTLVVFQAFNGDPVTPDAFQNILPGQGSEGEWEDDYVANNVYTRVRIRGLITPGVVTVDTVSLLTQP